MHLRHPRSHGAIRTLARDILQERTLYLPHYHRTIFHLVRHGDTADKEGDYRPQRFQRSPGTSVLGARYSRDLFDEIRRNVLLQQR